MSVQVVLPHGDSVSLPRGAAGLRARYPAVKSTTTSASKSAGNNVLPTAALLIGMRFTSASPFSSLLDWTEDMRMSTLLCFQSRLTSFTSVLYPLMSGLRSQANNVTYGRLLKTNGGVAVWAVALHEKLPISLNLIGRMKN